MLSDEERKELEAFRDNLKAEASAQYKQSQNDPTPATINMDGLSGKPTESIPNSLEDWAAMKATTPVIYPMMLIQRVRHWLGCRLFRIVYKIGWWPEDELPLPSVNNQFWEFGSNGLSFWDWVERYNLRDAVITQDEINFLVAVTKLEKSLDRKLTVDELKSITL
jgi:hypothetical protein